MTYQEVMAKLAELSGPEVPENKLRSGAGYSQFRVKMGDLRALAKSIQVNPPLASELWQSKNPEAMMLATLLMRPKDLSLEELASLAASVPLPVVADWLSTNVIKLHPRKEELRESWMNSPDEFTARLGWSLTAERIIKQPEGLNLVTIMDRIEAEMPTAPVNVQWNMNYSLAEIGIRNPELRPRALAMGEKIGAFRDYPTSKGCVSPFAPIWINEMVKRQSPNTAE